SYIRCKKSQLLPRNKILNTNVSIFHSIVFLSEYSADPTDRQNKVSSEILNDQRTCSGKWPPTPPPTTLPERAPPPDLVDGL
uniref:Uncharacterized protein n=1 Tax=Oryza brachyantha TaxID=4533 RepID=J3N8R6_ORYBR